MHTIDLNCDMGESYGNYKIGNDDKVFPHITSSNVACGFHGGDPLSIENTIKKAISHGVQVGAHPGYPDLMGFGRRKMHIPANQLKALLKYQVAAVKGLTESLGAKLAYVKPHGALYNSLSKDMEEAKIVIDAILEIDDQLKIMGLAGSQVKDLVESRGAIFIAEAFADRRYEPDGHLMSRLKEGAVLHDPALIADQVVAIVKNKSVESVNGERVELEAQSICIHGDNPAVAEILKAITERFEKEAIEKKAF